MRGVLPTITLSRTHWLLLVVLAAAFGCARNPRAVTPPTTARSTPIERLTTELDRLFLAPAFDHALWAAKVQSMETGEVLYELNPSKLVMPASNMKVVTMAAAAARLGWDHRYETTLATAGELDDDGVLHGDLVVRGTGDPSIGTDDEATAVFEVWAKQLAEAGVTAIDGRVVGNDDVFDDEGFGAAWSWDDIPYGYAAQAGALQYHQGIVELTVTPGDTVGAPARVTVTPTGSLLEPRNHVVTTAAEQPRAIRIARLPTRRVLQIRGTIPLGSDPYVRTAAVVNPTLFFVRALRATLIDRGIDVRGEAVDIDDLEPRVPGSDSDVDSEDFERVLVRHESPPLTELGAELMKISQNLYAETFLKTLGVHRSGLGTAADGRAEVESILASWGIPDTEHVIFDGSGLSRNNYLTADLLVKILRTIHRGPWYQAFVETLPIAGIDGTLENRMRATRAEGRVKAKTGSISNVRALSGYVPTLDGELLAFSIIANHFRIPARTVLDQIDLAAERLANFTRTR